MLGSLGKLFMTSDGKIPFTQIAIGVLIGAIAMYIYINYQKGDLPFGKRSDNSLQPVDIIEPLAAPPLPVQPQVVRPAAPPTMKARRMPQVKLAATMIPIPIHHDEEDYEDYDDEPQDRIVEQPDDYMEGDDVDQEES